MSSVNSFLSNHPSEVQTDCIVILRCLTLLEDERARLENALTSISRLWTVVDTQRQNVDRTISLYKAALAPINRLPMEVLQEVFLYCFPPRERAVGNLWALERVSRRWRHAALACAELWSDICITSNSLRWYNARDPVGMINTWLQRSRQYPLTVTFCSFSKKPAPFSMFAPLLQHCHRWRSLSLSIDFDSTIVAALESMRGKFPMLRSLELFFSYDAHRETTIMDAFSDSKRLSSMCLHYTHHYKLNALPDSLTSLTVATSNLLRDITAPHLKDLTIDGWGGDLDDDEIIPNTLGFIQRSSCTLESLFLNVGDAPLDPRELGEIFQLQPKLKSLELWCEGSSLFSISACLSASGELVPLPELNQLTIEAHLTETMVSRILGAVEGRFKCRDAVKLKRLALLGSESSKPICRTVVEKAKRLISLNKELVIKLETGESKLIFPLNKKL
ncbi:hypothetical protein AX16_007024 [Volvariella volvacea WC 439]|nr:hypothetical protein AX16_007024 [Volvariella volvacea WC 439]